MSIQDRYELYQCETSFSIKGHPQHFVIRSRTGEKGLSRVIATPGGIVYAEVLFPVKELKFDGDTVLFFAKEGRVYVRRYEKACSAKHLVTLAKKFVEDIETK